MVKSLPGMDRIEPLLYETMFQTPLLSLAMLVLNIRTLYYICVDPSKDWRLWILAVADFLSILVYAHASVQYFYYDKRIIFEIHCTLALYWFTSILLVTMALDYLGKTLTNIRLAVVIILTLLTILLDNRSITKALKLPLNSSQFYIDFLITLALCLPYLDMVVLTSLLSLRIFCVKSRVIEKQALGSLEWDLKLNKPSIENVGSDYMVNKESLKNCKNQEWQHHKSIDLQTQNLGIVLRLLGIFLFFTLPYNLWCLFGYWVQSINTNDGLYLVPMFFSCLRTICNPWFYDKLKEGQINNL